MNYRGNDFFQRGNPVLLISIGMVLTVACTCKVHPAHARFSDNLQIFARTSRSAKLSQKGHLSQYGYNVTVDSN